MTLPRSLGPGSRIVVVAPAGPPRNLPRLADGLDALRNRGYDVRLLRDGPLETAFAPHGYLSASDDARADEFNRALRDPAADAIFCVRGGYGTLRILDRIDYDAAQRHPKLLVGYSDITALQLALYAKAGWRSVSGAMVGVEWGAMDTDEERLLAALVGGFAGDVVGPAGERLAPLHAGDATGTLLGGNLALVARLVGTPYLPDLTGAILFLEDVYEEPYKIDGLLAQLKLAGHLERLGGLVYGAFTDGAPTVDTSQTTDEVLDHYAAFVNGPVAKGLAYGHFSPKIPMPIGVAARLTVDENDARLVLLEPVVGFGA